MPEKPKTIGEYIAAMPEQTQKRLGEMLECLRQAAPGAEENLKWGHPALSYRWILFQFAAFKDHINLYPTPSVVKAFAGELGEYTATASAIQFPLDRPLPGELIRKVAEYRVWESNEKGIKWM